MFVLSLKLLNLVAVLQIWCILLVLIVNLDLHSIPLDMHNVKINMLLVDEPKLCVVLNWTCGSRVKAVYMDTETANDVAQLLYVLPGIIVIYIRCDANSECERKTQTENKHSTTSTNWLNEMTINIIQIFQFGCPGEKGVTHLMFLRDVWQIYAN